MCLQVVSFFGKGQTVQRVPSGFQSGWLLGWLVCGVRILLFSFKTGGPDEHLLIYRPGVTKECLLEALKYLKTSKQHHFESAGIFSSILPKKPLAHLKVLLGQPCLDLL